MTEDRKSVQLVGDYANTHLKAYENFLTRGSLPADSLTPQRKMADSLAVVDLEVNDLQVNDYKIEGNQSSRNDGAFPGRSVSVSEEI